MQNFEHISLDFLSCTRETKRDTSSHLPLPFKWEIQGFHFKPYLRNKETFIRYVAHGTKKSKKVLGVLSKISYIIICTKDANLFSLLCYPYFWNKALLVIFNSYKFSCKMQKIWIKSKCTYSIILIASGTIFEKSCMKKVIKCGKISYRNIGYEKLFDLKTYKSNV